jgi:hypothetical protein
MQLLELSTDDVLGEHNWLATAWELFSALIKGVELQPDYTKTNQLFFWLVQFRCYES